MKGAPRRAKTPRNNRTKTNGGSTNPVGSHVGETLSASKRSAADVRSDPYDAGDFEADVRHQLEVLTSHVDGAVEEAYR